MFVMKFQTILRLQSQHFDYWRSNEVPEEVLNITYWSFHEYLAVCYFISIQHHSYPVFQLHLRINVFIFWKKKRNHILSLTWNRCNTFSVSSFSTMNSMALIGFLLFSISILHFLFLFKYLLIILLSNSIVPKCPSNQQTVIVVGIEKTSALIRLQRHSYLLFCNWESSLFLQMGDFIFSRSENTIRAREWIRHHFCLELDENH